MSLNGIMTVARLELLQRVRGVAWIVALVVWVAAIGGVTLLTWLSVGTNPNADVGGTVYDVVLFFVLGLAMLVMPALTSTSVNGDREHGVLATLQTSLLTATDIVLGKLLAAWLIATAFLGTALPFLVLGYLSGGVDILGAIRSLVVIVVVLAAICAVGLMYSTLTARPIGSAVLTYLSVAGLCFLTVIVFTMGLFLVTDKQAEVQVYGTDYRTAQPQTSSVPECTTYTAKRDVMHTEILWPILAVNPFVIVADAAPRGGEGDDLLSGFTPLRWISQGARYAKAGPQEPVDECWSDGEESTSRADKAGPVWPYGVGLFVLFGAGATAVAVARTRTPVRRLPSGTRIA